MIKHEEFQKQAQQFVDVSNEGLLILVKHTYKNNSQMLLEKLLPVHPKKMLGKIKSKIKRKTIGKLYTQT